LAGEKEVQKGLTCGCGFLIAVIILVIFVVNEQSGPAI